MNINYEEAAESLGRIVKHPLAGIQATALNDITVKIEEDKPHVKWDERSAQLTVPAQILVGNDKKMSPCR